MSKFVKWVFDGQFWNPVEVSEEEYLSLYMDWKPIGREYEYHGPIIVKDGKPYREQRLK
jgi:hypothetical protein